MRSFEFAVKKYGSWMYSDAKLPQYQTRGSAGADFFCAKEVTIPSIWERVANIMMRHSLHNLISLRDEVYDKDESLRISPTIVHTGIKASMYPDEVLNIYNRSSGPKKLGLILANSVGVIDSDYYGNPDNDGEIMFAFYNFLPWSVTIKVGDRIGQGVFSKVLRPEVGAVINNVDRAGGFGSTGVK